MSQNSRVGSLCVQLEAVCISYRTSPKIWHYCCRTPRCFREQCFWKARPYALAKHSATNRAASLARRLQARQAATNGNATVLFLTPTCTRGSPGSTPQRVKPAALGFGELLPRGENARANERMHCTSVANLMCHHRPSCLHITRRPSSAGGGTQDVPIASRMAARRIRHCRPSCLHITRRPLPREAGRNASRRVAALGRGHRRLVGGNVLLMRPPPQCHGPAAASLSNLNLKSTLPPSLALRCEPCPETAGAREARSMLSVKPPGAGASWRTSRKDPPVESIAEQRQQ